MKCCLQISPRRDFECCGKMSYSSQTASKLMKAHMAEVIKKNGTSYAKEVGDNLFERHFVNLPVLLICAGKST